MPGPSVGAEQDAALREPVAEARPVTADRSLLASSRTMAIASLASRVTGFLRSVALAAALGVGLVGDAYNGANSFPNMVYELLLGGVLSSVLIPLLVHAQEHDQDGGDAYTARLLSVATAALGVATLLAVLAAPWLADAFVSEPAQRSLTALFASLLLPEIFFYGLGAMFTAVLNTRGVYGPGAWAPVLNNVITLVTVGVFLALPGPKTLTPLTITTAQVLVIGIGTTLGIVGQAVVLWPFLKRTGFHWHWRFRADAAERESGRMRRGRDADRLGAGLRRGQPDRRHRHHQGRLHPRRRLEVHLRRPAVPGAVRHPRRLPAHRADAAAVAGGGARRLTPASSATSASAPDCPRSRSCPSRSGCSSSGRTCAWCCSRTGPPRSATPARSGTRWRWRRSGCSRSRSSCCSCACSTRSRTPARRRWSTSAWSRRRWGWSSWRWSSCTARRWSSR